MRKWWIDNREKMKTIIICGMIFMGMLSIIALVCGAIMRFLGFQYESAGSIVLFFTIATVISYPLNLVAGALPKALYELKRISKLCALVLYLILDTTATSLGLTAVDNCMSSVSATTISIVIISFLLALLGKDDFKDKQE